MAKSTCFLIILLAFISVSCDNLRGFGINHVDSVEVGDSVLVVTYETRIIHDTVTVYIQKERPNSKAQIYLDTLRSYLGTKEATGNNDGPEVEKFTKDACNMGQVSWCAAYLAYGLKVNGVEIPECACWSPCMVPDDKVVWKSGDEHSLMPGEIFGLYFRSKKRVAHVGAVVEDLGDGWILTIEGNTNDAGGREGNGVYKRLRHKSQIYVAAKWI